MTDEGKQPGDGQDDSGEEQRRQQEKNEELNRQKELEFYSQAVSAFFLTSLELDKSYLTISVAALGFWITLIATLKEGLFVSTFGVVFCVISLLAFMATCLLVLNIFHFNKDAILEIVNAKPGDAPGPTNKKIEKLDGWVRWAFGIGATSLVLFGMFTADRLLDHRWNAMTNPNDNNRPSGATPGMLNESFNKMENLRPQQQVTKSFSGAQQLRPQSGQANQGSNTGQAQASGTSTQTTPTSTSNNTGTKK
jgi:hypothetical protein